ncbi:MAG: NAD synthetase, partial [Candidatus Marinimicrobia bacterium]|nr:NAD synthetase [Candidatus Neomarinimicrobiota bacterium]
MDNMSTLDVITRLLYLLSAIFFITGLKNLSSPKTARRGNLYAMLGMFIAVVITLFDNAIISYTWIIVGLIVGGTIGGIAAKTVQMTQMPQMVAIFNGFGGGASTLVALAEYHNYLGNTSLSVGMQDSITISISIIIGTITFFGSFVAFGKLQGFVKGSPIVLPMHQALNALLFIGVVV